MGKVRSYVTSMIVQCLPPGAINKSHGISSTNNPKLCPICKEITWLCLQHGEISSAFKKRSPFTGIWSHIKKPVFWYYHCRAWGKNKPRLMVDQWKKSRSNNIETQQTQRLEVEKKRTPKPILFAGVTKKDHHRTANLECYQVSVHFFDDLCSPKKNPRAPLNILF